jgi:4-hydroxybenzoate polyprenyltransferase
VRSTESTPERQERPRLAGRFSWQTLSRPPRSRLASYSAWTASRLAAAVNALAAVIALLTMASYLLVYTPLKRKTLFCTVAGAIPGAAPPLIGWAVATGSLSLEAWLLNAIVFPWQFPHFMAIAWCGFGLAWALLSNAATPLGKEGRCEKA